MTRLNINGKPYDTDLPADTPLLWLLRDEIGLTLGGRTSASIALAIVAEIHAWLHGCNARPFAEQTGERRAFRPRSHVA